MLGWAPTLTGDNEAAAMHQVHRQSIRDHRTKHLWSPLSPTLEGATESHLRIAQRHHMLIFGQRERYKPRDTRVALGAWRGA